MPPYPRLQPCMCQLLVPLLLLLCILVPALAASASSLRPGQPETPGRRTAAAPRCPGSDALALSRRGLLAALGFAVQDEPSIAGSLAEVERLRRGLIPPLLPVEARREEIARMLAGATVTDEARAAAARLLEGA